MTQVYGLPRDVVQNGEFPELHYQGITFFIMTCTFVVYLGYSRGIMNHDFNMFARKGGMKTLKRTKNVQVAQGNLSQAV